MDVCGRHHHYGASSSRRGDSINSRPRSVAVYFCDSCRLPPLWISKFVRRMRSAMVVDEARARGAGIIISFHDLDDTPSHKRLCEIARTARLLRPSCLKIATRTDTPAQLARLLDFFQVERGKMIIAAMGMGRLGVVARREFFRRGSFLTYGNLGEATIAGQPSISSIRRWSKGSGQRDIILIAGKARRGCRARVPPEVLQPPAIVLPH